MSHTAGSLNQLLVPQQSVVYVDQLTFSTKTERYEETFHLSNSPFAESVAVIQKFMELAMSRFKLF